MTSSRSFDQAAEYYDSTRPLFDDTAKVGLSPLDKIYYLGILFSRRLEPLRFSGGL